MAVVPINLDLGIDAEGRVMGSGEKDCKRRIRHSIYRKDIILTW